LPLLLNSVAKYGYLGHGWGWATCVSVCVCAWFNRNLEIEGRKGKEGKGSPVRKIIYKEDNL